MLSVITGDPKEIADEMLTHADVDVVTFTGGVPIGKYIAAKAVYKRQVLELGGNDPLIVMDDADVNKAAELAANGSYKNSGQRCTAVKRIFVHERIAARLHRRAAGQDQGLDLRRPARPEGRHGHGDRRATPPCCSSAASTTRWRRARGCCTATSATARSYSPTLIDRVRGEMEVVKQETFGPVSPVITFKDVDDAIAQVNSTAYGLSSGVCTNRLDDIMRFVKELNVGSVNVWEVPGYRLEADAVRRHQGFGHSASRKACRRLQGFTNVKTYSLPW